ncbi:hypothetical protein RSK20926_21095 [Roseobacter sp. SK209-2-6]|uniref:SPOR domain-containing protein n=1 Tax=Roseobacter sp. SK209-2-6 TaxID=388739 RepID=UPI0000F3E7D5|nr:SPOR domain-containing protein [Roseobacter sp. SK209-2-6]EBA16263.1 hypothetical protein RSK20926_21095 [Roseobacter sp. SK209-2-6]
MAYFAQAGSGPAFSHSGSQSEGAAPETSATQAQPHLQAPDHGHQQVTHAPAVHATRAQPQAGHRSQFPHEGPDLYSNYVSEPQDLPAANAASQAATASATGPRLEVTQVQGARAQASAPQAAAPVDAASQAAAGQGPRIFAKAEPELASAYAQNPSSGEYGEYVSQDYGVSGLENAATAGQDLRADQAVYRGAGASFGYDGAEVDDYGYDDAANENEQYQPPVASGRGFTKAASVLGAVASFALVIGLGVWGYQLVMRDVSGLPVVRSVEGPMRVQPENPGGSQADHQGLAVNSVAATGAAEAPADRLTLAPQPIELTEDDQPASVLQAPAADPAPVIALTSTDPAAGNQSTEDAAEAFRNGDIDALVAELTDGVEPISDLEPVSASAPVGLGQVTTPSSPAIVQPEPLQPTAVAAIESSTPAALALLKAPGVKLSLRPNLRPARFSPAQATPAKLSGPATEELDPASLPAGTRLAQLGAYESAAVARAEWDRIASRFGDYLDGKKRVVQRAESGGRTFYRLRAVGFEGLSDARRFCSALVARNADCIPVTTR